MVAVLNYADIEDGLLQGFQIETCSFCAIDGFALKLEMLAIRQLF